MRQGSNGRRSRGRHHGGGNGGNSGGSSGANRSRSAASLRHQSFDSNCGDLRVRGNAWQVHEKYQALARDATSSGDRVSAENYLQHAEHYFRIIEAINEATAAEQRIRGDVGGFGAQPDTPTHYYSSSSGAPAGADAGQPAATPVQAEATVQPLNPPPSSFFTQEEVEEHNRDQAPLAMAR